MRKKSIVGLGAVVLLVAFIIGIYQSNPANSAPRLTNEDVTGIVMEQYPGDVEDMRLDRKGKHAVYTVDLIFEEKAYQMQVDGDSGEIVHVKEKGAVLAEKGDDTSHDNMLENDDSKDDANDDKDQSVSDNKQDKIDEQSEDTNESEEKQQTNDSQADDKKSNDQKKDQSEQKKKKKEKKENQSKEKESSSVLSAVQAIDLAKQEFSGIVIEIERDKNNGRLIYEIELVGNGEKAEIELDAMNGKVVSLQIKSDKKSESKYSGAPLTMEDAIIIAQRQFDGVLDEGELEIDNGRFFYEIELMKNGQEVEMLIDGHTGEVVEYDD